MHFIKYFYTLYLFVSSNPERISVSSLTSVKLDFFDGPSSFHFLQNFLFSIFWAGVLVGVWRGPPFV